MDERILANFNKYAKLLVEKKYIESGFIATRHEDGVIVAKVTSNLEALRDENLVFVNDKNVESLEGNFRAAAVILFCAIRQDKKAEAAAIVDSDKILAFSSKRKTLKPILDDMAQVCGVSIKCAAKNTAAEVVSAISGQRNACFLPDAGAVVTGRTLEEVFTATLVLDKACNAEILAEPKGGTSPMGACNAILEHVVYKIKYSKKNQAQQKEAEEGAEKKAEEKPSAIVSDEEKKIAQDIKNAGLRMLDENLVQGTWGNISVKLDEKTMLCTPSALDYIMLEPSQMAKVDMETLEWTGSNKATSEKGLHALLLKGDENVGAVIHSHPVYGCILAAMGKALPVPEEYREILGDEIPCAKAALPGTKALIKNVGEAIGSAPCCILSHHGVITRGKDLEDAFRICRALEDACKTYLEG